jgi:endonuclease/exonuclease/phosphatase family metal-dependent hydrolase
MSRASRVFCSILFGILAVASLEARTVRVATFNIENGPGAPGSADYEATKAVLARLDADVVGFQEILSSSEQNWRALAADTGYAHLAFGRDGTSMSGNQRLGYFSRFPITSEAAITSPPGADELTRRPLRVVIAVPGAAKPLVVWNMHHKADDPTPANTPGNQFRRAIEARRIAQDINVYRSANPDHDEFVMLGDLNDDIFQASNQAVEFQSIPSLTSSSYRLGSDIVFPVAYRAFPDDRYGSAGGGLHRLDLRQQNGTSRSTRPVSGRTLDYLLVSTALRDSPLAAPRGEVYNSQWDALNPGLPKAGSALPSGTSLAASDHLAVVADIEMDDASPSLFVNSFSPGAAAPGVQVTIEGLLLEGVTSVRFGGVEATDFSVVNGSQIVATVPQGAWTGPISVSGPKGSASSYDWFLVAALPTAAFATAGSSSLTGFAANQGTASSSQVVAVSAAGLGGPLQISAPPGFEVSTNGTNYFSSVTLSAPPRSDAASNYSGSWTNGSTAGNGFLPWEIFANAGTGQAEAYLGNPTNSDVEGMAPTAFALRASPESSGASVWALRQLEAPLAAGEALSFDWGINWDSNNGSKGFSLVSGAATILSVIQYGYPGQVYLWYGDTFVDTGLAYGTRPMRWTFRQVDAQTLNVTATSREGGNNVVYSANVPVPGAVTSVWWFAAEMEPDVRRISYYDNLNIAPVAPGGGAFESATLHVRLSPGLQTGEVAGQLQLSSSAGEVLASVALSGAITGAGAAYDNWAVFHGLDPQGDGAPGADKDGDGHSNWLEFAFGTSPVTSDGTLVRARTSGEGVTFEFLRRQSGVIYGIFQTSNLAAAFSTASGIEVSVSSDRTGVPDGWEKADFTVPAVGTGFYRISASPN